MRYSGRFPPMATTCAMPGMASRRLRSENSAISRRARPVTFVESETSATIMISPETEMTGAISGSASLGSDSRTCPSRSNTRKRAESGSDAQSKSTHTKESPPPELERMFVTPLSPFMADSIGTVMRCSTSSAVSPPASVWIVTRGTLMSGNTSTASRCDT